MLFMNAVGIIVEYNPLHNGHIHHIKEAKRLTNADVVIAVISSNFTQRGEPAIIDKKSRTISALENGVDLVVELPFLYSVESPNMFAFGALSILNDLGVKNVVFGIDEYDTKTFMETCEKKQFSSPRLDEMIQEYISKGYAYSEAKSLGLQAINDFYLELPNDILGYAIIKTINEQKMNITPIAI